MSLKYEPSSEPLHISAKQLFLNPDFGERLGDQGSSINAQSRARSQCFLDGGRHQIQQVRPQNLKPIPRPCTPNSTLHPKPQTLNIEINHQLKESPHASTAAGQVPTPNPCG